MISLANICVILGGLYIVLHLPLMVMPQAARRFLRAFPRNKWAGGGLAIVALAWAAWEVYDMPLGMIDQYKIWLWAIGPVTGVLVLTFMNELLAVRALGGILMLAACPVLEIQRLNASYWTWVPAGLVYIWVVAGMILMLSPYRFRHVVERFCATDRGCMAMGAGGVAMGGVLIALGLRVF